MSFVKLLKVLFLLDTMLCIQHFMAAIKDVFI